MGLFGQEDAPTEGQFITRQTDPVGFVFDEPAEILGQRTEQVPTLTPNQLALLNQIISTLGPQIGQGVTPFQGTRPGEVPFGPLQQQGFGLAGGLGPGISAGLQGFGQFDPSQGQGFLGQAQGALQQGLGFDPTQSIMEAFEPSRRLAMSNFQQNIVPTLLERFGATSGPSGSLNRALSEAGAGLELGLSAQTAPFIGQAALQQPGLQFQGAQLGGQLAGIPGQLAQQGAQLGGMGLEQLFNIGGLQQQLPIGIAAANQARFAEAQPFANPYLQLLGSALDTTAFDTAVFQGFRQPSRSETMMPSGSSAGGAIGGALLSRSDIKVKENIQPIENALEKVSQLDGKTYNFIGKLEKDGGLIAQDIEKVLSGAVVEIDGVKHVKYEAVIGLLVSAVNELQRKVG